MTYLTAIIVDDEPDCVRLLNLQLNMYCKEVKVVASCTASESAVIEIKRHKPDVIFLDIEMPVLNGFQLLEQVASLDFSLIFITAYDRFAVRAFRYSALDYLLKPIDAKELIAAVAKVGLRRTPQFQQLSLLRRQLQQREKLPESIALPYQNGVTFVEIKSVVLCESDNNYTKVHMEGLQVYTIARTLARIQEMLEDSGFVRVHRQFLVNLSHIRKFVRGEGNYLVMTNGRNIPVSRHQKEKLMEKFGWP